MKASKLNPRIAPAVVLIASACLVAACGKDGGESAAEAPQPAATQAQGTASPATSEPAAPAAEERLADYATAVESGKGSAPVDLKFNLLAKPEVGQPFEIELAFVPRLPADKLEVEVTGIEGLTIVGDGRYTFDSVQAGEVYAAKVLVRADAAGLYYAGVSARMITPVQTEARAFSVPMVVGEAVAAEKAAPEVDATGHAVQSMPAEETVEEKK